MDRKNDPTTLLAHFELDPQICKALPGNIRRLVELQRRLHSTLNVVSNNNGVNHVLLCLWRDALAASALLPREKEELAKTVSVDEFGNYLVVAGGGCFSFTAKQTFPAHPFTTHEARVQHIPSSLSGWSSFYIRNGLSVRLSEQVTACLMLATNIAATMGMFDSCSPVLAEIFGESTFVSNGKASLRLSWPTPPWESFSDVFLVMSARPLQGTPDSKEMLDAHIKMLLYVAACVGIELKNDSFPAESTISWQDVATLVHKLATSSMKMHPRRWKLLQKWARSRAGLFACPEFGLSAPHAKEWLDALEAAFGATEWPAIREELIVERERRMNTAINEVGGLKTTSDAVFEELASLYAGHPGNNLRKNPSTPTPSTPGT